MEENFEVLQGEDVVEINESGEKDVQDLLNAMDITYLFKVENLMESLADPKNLLKDGLACRVMTTRQKGWISGKVKLGLHFIADEVADKNEESQSLIKYDNPLDDPLDEIRNTVA
jgi:hypothetical protein